jgi:isopentenyl diphosphate isomerase/L-lactate dehydrogenase-like FMN-dependent dehydrogenase
MPISIATIWCHPRRIAGKLASEKACSGDDAGGRKLSADDAVISNQGTRQLDDVPVCGVAAASNRKCSILIGNGIRLGADVVKVLARSAK